MSATTKATIPGFAVLCPYCFHEDGKVTLELRTLECECPECSGTFGVHEAYERAQALANAWARVAKWVEMIPPGPAE